MTLKAPILFQWLYWHFIETPKNIMKAWSNFLVFTFRYFSIIPLFCSLFSHWRRDSASYGRGFDLKRYFQAFFSNMISRILGAITRSIVIFLGLLFEILVFVCGLCVFCLWLVLPFISLGLLLSLIGVLS